MPGWTLIPQARNQTLLTKVCPITRNGPGDPDPPNVAAAQMRMNLAAGDLLIFFSRVEMRVPMAYNTNTAGYLRYTFNNQLVAVDDPVNPGGGLTRPMGENRWVDPHYRIDVQFVPWVVPDTGIYVVQHMVYGASSAYTAANAATEKIDLMYADQRAVVLRPDSDDPLAALTARVAALEAGGN